MMKKYILLVLSCFSLLVRGYTQPQRLAVIPMPGASNFLSLCVDYFAEIPAEGQAMDQVMSFHPGSQTVADPNLSNIRITGTGKFSEVKVENAGAVKDPFWVGTADANRDISANYTQFIENRIKHFKTLGLTESHMENLQEQIWQYDVLKHLGYLKETGNPFNDYEKAVSVFQNNLGPLRTQWGESRILSIAEGVKSVGHGASAQLENTHFLYIAKNKATGSYIAFDQLGSPIFHGLNKTALVDILNKNYRDGDNVFIAFDESMNYNNRQAFMTDFEIRFKTQKNKTLSVSENNEVLVSDKLSHTLSPPNDEIKQVQIKSQNYYEGRQSVISTLEKSGLGELQSDIIALSPKKNVVAAFVSTFRTRFDSFVKGKSLASFILSIKRNVEETMGISKKELVVIFNSEGRLSYFTRKQNRIRDYVVRN